MNTKTPQISLSKKGGGATIQTKTTQSKVNGGEWVLVVLALGFIDILQIILNFFAVGIIANRIIDIIIGLSFAIYLYFRGEFNDPKTRGRLITGLAVVFVGEQIPLIDSAPFWFLDGLFCWHQSNLRNRNFEEQEKNKAAEDKKQKIESQVLRQQQIQQLGERQCQQRLMAEQERDEME